MKKKAQAEMLGLLVIIILIVVVIGIFIAFSISSTGKDKDTLRKNLQTTKMSDAVLQYTPNCPGEVQKDMRKIIKDCNLEENNAICGQPCKELITTEIKNIIRSIEAQQPSLTYGINITKESQTLAIQGCQGATVITDNYQDPSFALLLIQCSK